MKKTVLAFLISVCPALAFAGASSQLQSFLPGASSSGPVPPPAMSAAFMPELAPGIAMLKDAHTSLAH
ncbi:MAG TPA: hypothetical protein PLL10_07530, partial [Elusimicrobiales bacterium]|nr:hypothetical protein [Elusimicrobiales bacterium]